MRLFRYRRFNPAFLHSELEGKVHVWHLDEQNDPFEGQFRYITEPTVEGILHQPVELLRCEVVLFPRLHPPRRLVGIAIEESHHGTNRSFEPELLAAGKKIVALLQRVEGEELELGRCEEL